MASLDEIMAGKDATASEPVATETTVPEVVPVIEEVAAPQEPEAPVQEDTAGAKTVPVAAVHEEREKSRKYKEELAETRREISELRALMMQQVQRPAPQHQAPVPPPEPPDYFDNPREAVGYQMQSAMAPVQQALMYNARLTAEAIHTSDKVKEAEAEFNRLSLSGEIDPRVHSEINRSPNPFHAAVKWLEQQKRAEVFARMGPDPEAYIAAELEKRLAALTAQPQTTSQARPLPTSLAATPSQAGASSGSGYSGPRPLSEIMKR